MLNKAVFPNNICSAQTRVHSKLSNTFQAIERRMALYQTREPKHDFIEIAHLGRRFHWSSDVTVTYDTRSGSYGVENGRITQKTPVRGKSTTLEVKSNNGYWFTVTRRKGGEYETDSWWTWVEVERIPVS